MIRSIVVRGPNWVGDVVMATPGLRALRRAHPDARIVVQLRRGLEPLLAGAPFVDAIALLDPAARGAAALFRAGRALRREHGRFDLGICLPDSFSSALVLRAAGVRRVVGFARAGRGILLHRTVSPRPEWGRRRLVARERQVLELLADLGVPECGTHLELHTTPEEEAAADAALLAGGIAGDTPLVVLAPGAAYGPSKCWPPERFAAVGDAAAARGAALALLGSPGERRIADEVRAALRAPVADLVGAVDLGAAKAVLRRAALLVCNDAGTRHVAVAFGVPVLAFFGPTDLAKTDMNLDSVHVFQTDVACRPCYLRECPIDHPCMTGIAVDPVIARVDDLLSGAVAAR